MCKIFSGVSVAILSLSLSISSFLVEEAVADLHCNPEATCVEAFGQQLNGYIATGNCAWNNQGQTATCTGGQIVCAIKLVVNGQASAGAVVGSVPCKITGSVTNPPLVGEDGLPYFPPPGCGNGVLEDGEECDNPGGICAQALCVREGGYMWCDYYICNNQCKCPRT